MLNFNLLNDKLINQFLDVYRDLIIYNTYRHAKIKREFAAPLKKKIKNFLECYKSTQDLNDFEEVMKIIGTPQIFSINSFDYNSFDGLPQGLTKENKIFYSNMKFTRNVEEAFSETSNIITLHEPLIIETLIIQYNTLFDELKSGNSDELNKCFLLLYSILIKRYNPRLNLEGFTTKYDFLSCIFENFLDIIIDDKCFNLISTLEGIIVTDTSFPDENYFKLNSNMFLKAAQCYYYLNEKSKGENVLIGLFAYMDKEQEIIEDRYEYFEKQIENEVTNEEIFEDDIYRNYIFKNERKRIYETYNNPKTNWSFSNMNQFENACILGLIADEKIKKLRWRLEREQAIENELVSLLSEPFAKLEIDLEFDNLPQIDCLGPQDTGYNGLILEQKIEYRNAFYSTPNLHLIRKYLQLRLDRVYLEIMFFKKYNYLSTAFTELEIFESVQKSSIHPHIHRNRLTALEQIGEQVFLEKVDKFISIYQYLKERDGKSSIDFYDNGILRLDYSLAAFAPEYLFNHLMKISLYVLDFVFDWRHISKEDIKMLECIFQLEGVYFENDNKMEVLFVCRRASSSGNISKSSMTKDSINKKDYSIKKILADLTKND